MSATQALDDAGTNLKAYIDSISDDRLREYETTWTDEQVIAWEPNFRNDGCLMLVCCSRDVEVEEYREALEARIRERSNA